MRPELLTGRAKFGVARPDLLSSIPETVGARVVMKGVVVRSALRRLEARDQPPFEAATHARPLAESGDEPGGDLG